MIEQVDGGPIDRNFDELDRRRVETGTVAIWAGIALPDGWVLCDGATYKRAALPQLFGVIGTAFGAAAADSFVVPNLAGFAGVRYMIRV